MPDDDGCCHKTRLRRAPCPLGRVCPYDEGVAVAALGRLPDGFVVSVASVVAQDGVRASEGLARAEDAVKFITDAISQSLTKQLSEEPQSIDTEILRRVTLDHFKWFAEVDPSDHIFVDVTGDRETRSVDMRLTARTLLGEVFIAHMKDLERSDRDAVLDEPDLGLNE